MRDIQITFIGSGGKQPGIDGITSFGNMVRLADYGNGCSVYDLHYSPFDHKLTAGDRGGYVKRYWLNKDANELVLLSEYNHGTPVISVMQYNSLVHSAGFDSKLIVWQGPDYCGDCFDLGSQQTVSLEPVTKHNVFASIAVNGDMHFWGRENQLMKTMHGPVPGGPHSLTRLFYWQRYDMLVYPGSDGQLVCRDCRDFSCRTFSGHDSGFVTLFADGEYLYTVGINDGTLKRWIEPGKSEIFICEPRIIGGSRLPGSDNRIGLINSEGDFLDCVIEKGVKIVSRKKGDFRCFMRMSGEDIAELCEQERQGKAESIQQTILSNIEKQQVEQNITLYFELQQNGYEKACLALQSYEGQVCQNRSLEFAAKHKLSQIVSSVHLEPEFLHRYIGIALDAGQVECAHDIAQRFGSVLGTEVVDFVLSLVEAGQLIVDLSGWDVAELGRIWTITNQAIVGSFIIEQGTSLKVPILNGSVDEIVKHISVDLPDVKIAKVPLLDSSGYRNIKMITFSRNSVGASSVQITPVLMQMDANVCFALMADIDDQHITSIPAHNTSVAKVLNEYKGRLLDIVTDDLLQTVKGAVLKTLNERRAESCQQELI